MPKYVIERDIPGVGASTADALQAVSQTSCNVLKRARARDTVGPKLCHRRQDLLRLHRPERGLHPRTRHSAAASRQTASQRSRPSSIRRRPKPNGARTQKIDAIGYVCHPPAAAAFIAVLSFLFFLAMMFAYYIRQSMLYFLLATAFLIVYIITMISLFRLRRK